MKYSERIGASKLHVMRDGVRFLRAILGSIFYFRPERLFLLGTSATGLLILLMGIHPTEFYMQNRRLEEWMIYRFMACFLLALAGYLMFCSAALSTQLNMMWRDLKGYQSFWAQAAAALFQPGGVLLVTIACFVLSTGLLWPGIVEYTTSRTCSLHWSRLVVGGYFIFVAVQTIITGILMRLMLGFASNRELRSRATSWQN